MEEPATGGAGGFQKRQNLKYKYCFHGISAHAETAKKTEELTSGNFLFSLHYYVKR